MIYEFRLPDLGEGIAEGEVVKWKVKEGDTVEEHQVVAEVETDKAIVEVPAPKRGKVARIGKAAGETVKVGEVLLNIETGDGAGGAAPAEERAVKDERARPASVSVVGTMPEKEEAMASPKARSLAKKLGVEISKVAGRGPGGIITEDDVRAAASVSKEKQAGPQEALKAEPAGDRFGPVEKIPVKGVRKAIIKNLLAVQKSAAFVTGMDDADVTELWELKERERKVAREKGVHLTFMPFFIKAVQHALSAHPALNASIDEAGEEITIKKYFNMGVAVQTPEGLMVPVVKGVEKKTILDLAAELMELSKKARDRKITIEELKGSTFTITNYGSFGGTYATPIINSPDVAILGTGRVSERPWVKDGAVAVRKVLPLSLTFDHRVTDGAEAAQFLTKVVNYLEDPARIFIESA